MLYSYEDHFYVFGKTLVSLVIPQCNWSDDNEFAAYCQSEREIEYCSPIEVEELSLQSICEIFWHLEKRPPVFNDFAINNINSIFYKQRFDSRERPLLNGKSQIYEDDDKFRSPSAPLWTRFVSWLYDEKPSQAAARHLF